MLSTLPVDLSKVTTENIDKEILRAAILAELDATSFYEQMADKTSNPHIKKILLDVAREEKTHVGEFQTMLLKVDPEQTEELANGKKEVEEMLS